MIDVAPDEYLLRSEGLVSSQFGVVRDKPKGNGGPAYLQGEELMQPQYHMLFPNFTLNIDPGPGNMSVDVTRPAGRAAARARPSTSSTRRSPTRPPAR